MTLNMPGFTAEASLSNVSGQYRATSETVSYGGIVQPALSDVFHLGDETRHVYHPYLFNCLKWECVKWRLFKDPDGPWYRGCVGHAWVPAVC